MEWNAKWDWESLAELSSKACESPQKLQLTDWGIVEEEGEIVNAPFNNKNNISGGSYVYDAGGQGSSTSSPKNGGAKSENRREKDASIGGSAEACIGLKLGKRTYFENHGGGGVGGGNGGKTRKPSTAGGCEGGAGARCQVEGCHVDLSSGKEYHRKHRVCESHSKYPKVMVGGLERRFCQQCSRFHSLSEFDEKKRSCRRRLCDHNARRRKPQQDAFQFNNSTNRLSTSFYDGRQQINFMMNNVPLFDTNKTASNSTCWENNNNTYASNMYTITRGFTSQPEKPGSTNKQSYMSTGIHQPNTCSFRDNNVSDDVLLESKGHTEEGFTQGGKRAMFYMETSMAEKYPRALSLLSTSSWGSCEDQHNNSSISESANPTTALHEQQTIPLHLPLTPPQYWQPEPTNGHLPDVHNLFKVPQDADFYLDSFN